jgi:hypothetical protein
MQIRSNDSLIAKKNNVLHPCAVANRSCGSSFQAGFRTRLPLHIDMNHSVPEAAALEAVLLRLFSGGAIILDDYGW